MTNSEEIFFPLHFHERKETLLPTPTTSHSTLSPVSSRLRVKIKKNPIFHPKILTIKLCIKIVKWNLTKFLLSQELLLPKCDHLGSLDTNCCYSHKTKDVATL